MTSNARAEKRAAAFDGFAAYTFHMDDVFDTNQIFDEAGWTPALWKAAQTRPAASKGDNVAINGAPSVETAGPWKT